LFFLYRRLPKEPPELRPNELELRPLELLLELPLPNELPEERPKEPLELPILRGPPKELLLERPVSL
jgi:hypothetical protein